MFLLEERTKLILCHQMVLIKDFTHGGVFEGWGSCYMSNLVKLKTPSLNSGVTAQRLKMRQSERVGEAGSLCRRTLGQAAEAC